MRSVQPFFVAFAVAAIITPVLARAASAVGLVDRPAPGPLKIHVRPVPISGGIAVAVASLAGLAVLRWPSGYAVVALSAGLVLGLVDDVRPLPPWPRVALLAGIGAALAAGGVFLGPAGPWGAAGIIVVTVATANAVNILDGQDGLAGGLGAISALGLASLGMQTGAPGATGLGLVLAGALGGFLLWNRPPARVFLGDGGAYAAGVLLAVMAADVTARAGWSGLLASALCLGVFAFELVFSVTRRAGTRSLLRADRLHSYDLITLRLQDRWRSTLRLWGWGATGVLAAQLVPLVPLPFAAVGTGLLAMAAGLGAVRLWSEARTEVS